MSQRRSALSAALEWSRVLALTGAGLWGVSGLVGLASVLLGAAEGSSVIEAFQVLLRVGLVTGVVSFVVHLALQVIDGYRNG